jgi:hypothetical protein
VNQSARIYTLPSTRTKTWDAEEDVPHGFLEDQLFSTQITQNLVSLRELLKEIRSERAETVSPTRTVVFSPKYEDLQFALVEAMERGEAIALRRPNDIPLHALLRFVAILTITVSAGSLVAWLADIPPLVNPFAALLGLVAGPFFFAMSKATRLISL